MKNRYEVTLELKPKTVVIDAVDEDDAIEKAIDVIVDSGYIDTDVECIEDNYDYKEEALERQCEIDAERRGESG